jgi:hypothetical protein
MLRTSLLALPPGRNLKTSQSRLTTKRGSSGGARGGEREREREVEVDPLTRLFVGCLDLAARHFLPAAAADPDAFARLPTAAVCALLSHEALAAPDEDAVLALAVRWAGYDEDNAEEGEEAVKRWKKSLADVEEVLPYVRFPQLTSGALTALEDESQEVEGRGGLCAANSPVLRSLVAEARLVQTTVAAAAAAANAEENNNSNSNNNNNGGSDGGVGGNNGSSGVGIGSSNSEGSSGGGGSSGNGGGDSGSSSSSGGSGSGGGSGGGSSTALPGAMAVASDGSSVGLCTLNQVDP